ncbi:MAG: methionine--tRNA ligase [Patescibacteria group bacterium]
MSPKKPLFISTAIPYVNAKPHLGHALEFVETDIIARYNRLLGKEVFFLSGTDDNASKNVEIAEAAGVPIKEFVSTQAENFKKLLQDLGCENNDFIQTGIEERHIKGAQKLWNLCKKGDIELRKYKGLYCVGCEEFKTDKDIVNNECPLHPGRILQEIEEENYFFKLKNYEKELLDLIESNKLKIVPETRRNEILSFIKGGLNDLSISRSKERVKNWGIPVPNDDTQMMYVWFDALSNYINALGFAENSEKFQKFWENGESIHVVGKDISRFHAVYWPAMLMSAGIKTPDIILVHGFITSGGQKMSKSIGNVIDPYDLINEYGAEAARYILARHVSVFEDSDLTKESIKEYYNAGLANGLGNLVSRIMKMATVFGIKLDKYTKLNVAGPDFSFDESMNSFEINSVMNFIWTRIAYLDGYIQVEEPFKKIKIKPEEAKNNLIFILNELRDIAENLLPFLPNTAKNIIYLIESNKSPETPLFPRKD